MVDKSVAATDVPASSDTVIAPLNAFPALSVTVPVNAVANALAEPEYVLPCELILIAPVVASFNWPNSVRSGSSLKVIVGSVTATLVPSVTTAAIA